MTIGRTILLARVPARWIRALSFGGGAIAIWLAADLAARGVGLPFMAGAIAATAIIAFLTIREFRVDDSDGLLSDVPVVAFVAVLIVLESGVIASIPFASGPYPHRFSNAADEAYTVMIAQSLAQSFPPRDLALAGETIRYHFAAPLLADGISRLTGLPRHTTYYLVFPLLFRLVLLAAVVEIAARWSPETNPWLRTFAALPMLAGYFTVDLFAFVWHGNDVLRNGWEAFANRNFPLFDFPQSVVSKPQFDASWLAAAFALILVARVRRAGIVESAALLFAVNLSKAQVMLPVGLGWGVYASIRFLRNRDVRPLIAGSLALAAMVLTLPWASMYGDLAHLAPGCAACTRFPTLHNLGDKLAPGVVTAIELAGYFARPHVFWPLLGFLAWRKRGQGDVALAISIALAGLLLPLLVRLEPTPLLRARFSGVYRYVAQQLFMPYDQYLDRILDMGVETATDAFSMLLPLLAVPSLLHLARENRRWIRRSAWLLLSVCTGLSVFFASFFGARRLAEYRPKEVPLVVVSMLQMVPPHAVILTNDLLFDESEAALPLLNLWAPAIHGNQFWASAFMFEFQKPSAVERIRQVRWFFSDAPAAAEREEFLRRNGIDAVLLRTDLVNSSFRVAEGLKPVAVGGDYALYLRGRASGKSGME